MAGITLTVPQLSTVRQLAEGGGFVQRYKGTKGQWCWNVRYGNGNSEATLYGTMICGALHKKGVLVPAGPESSNGTQDFKLSDEIAGQFCPAKAE